MQLFGFGIAIAIFLLAGVQTAFAVGTNGSFETGTDPGVFTTLAPGDSTTITDWTVGASGVDYIGTYWVASDGVRSIDLNALDAGSISQTFPTVIGATYDVTFDLSGNPGGGPALKEISVGATGAAPQNFTYDTFAQGNTLVDMKWASHTYSFVASVPNTTLIFQSLIASASGPALDDVSIVETLPPPPPPSGCSSSSSSGGSSVINGIVITVTQSGCIVNTTSSSASTGGNNAGGSRGGRGGRGGDVSAVATGGSANGNNGGADAGNGGGGGAGGAGGAAASGPATATSNTTNLLNRVRIRINF